MLHPAMGTLRRRGQINNPTIYEGDQPTTSCGWPGDFYPQLDMSR